MLCFSGEMPMPVSVTSNAITVGALSSTGWPGVQPRVRDARAQAHAAALGELERVRQQVLEDLLQALGIGVQRAAELGREVDREIQRAAFGFVAEAALEVLAQVRERDLLAVDGDRARLDLRQVEDVADQVQQVGAGRVDRLGELDLAFG